MGVAGTRVYEGRRTATGCEVTVDGKPLDPRFDLFMVGSLIRLAPSYLMS